MRVVQGLIVVFVAAGLLSGCAPDPGAAEPDPTVRPTPSAAAPVARPAAQWDLDCAQLVPADTLGNVVTVGLVPADYRLALPWANSVPEAAVLQAGGLSCEWNTGPGPSARWEISAWPDPDGDGFAADQAYLTGQEYGPWTAIDALDGAAAYCTGRTDDPAGIRCRWIALSDGVALRADLWEVRPGEVMNPDPAPNADTSIPPLQPSGTATLALFGDLLGRIASADDIDLEPLPPTATPSCDQRLTKAAVATALGIPAASVSYARAVDEPQPALRLVGGSGCFATTADLSIAATIAPGLGWTIDKALDGDPDLSEQPIAGLDRGLLRCGDDEGGYVCSAAALDGDDLLSVTVTDQTGNVSADQMAALLATLKG